MRGSGPAVIEPGLVEHLGDLDDVIEEESFTATARSVRGLARDVDEVWRAGRTGTTYFWRRRRTPMQPRRAARQERQHL